CVPSRTGFMTSKFPATFAKYPANGGFGDRVTITELLKKQGYATGHFGKWHIGPETKPGTYGIDAINSYEDPPGSRRQLAERGKDAPVYEDAIRFIEQHRNEPFYVNVWGHAPHHPVNPSPAMLEAFGALRVDESLFPPPMREKLALCKKSGGDVSEHMRKYLAEIKAVDDVAGRLVKRLDELGLREKTIVVFSSDQGPAPILVGKPVKPKAGAADPQSEAGKRFAANNTDAIRLNAMGFAGPFRGGKHNQYEGGIRIPFIVRWPGHVPAGRVDERSVISGADWLPTLCALTGTKINAADFDGEDASAAWLGKGEHVRAKPLMWKTSAPQTPGTIREGQWKLHYPNSKRTELELYDVVADPGEQHNLVKDHPDIVKRLSAKLEAWQATLPKVYDKGEAKD
ncbi:MAG: Cerebroside-sulfatase, partial [Verrucomicrobia bacterium]|nr:Cerebroside-sulfatase [Verrucomicrobiota bacterium]